MRGDNDNDIPGQPAFAGRVRSNIVFHKTFDDKDKKDGRIRQKSKLDEAIEKKRDSRNILKTKSEPARKLDVGKKKNKETKSILKKKGGTKKRRRKRARVMFDESVMDKKPFVTHTEGRTRNFSINKETLKNRKRVISISKNKDVISRTKNARNFFTNMDSNRRKVSVIDRPTIRRNRVVSIIGRRSVAKRTEEAKKKFDQVDSQDSEHYKTTVCPGCEQTVYFNERHPDKDGVFWHETCLKAETRTISLFQVGTEVLTSFGRGIVAEYYEEKDMYNIKFSFGIGYLNPESLEFLTTAQLFEDMVSETRKINLADSISNTKNVNLEKFQKLDDKHSTVINRNCPACGEKVFQHDLSNHIEDTLWHRDCFRCCICNKVLHEDFKTNEKKPMCFTCYEEEILSIYWAEILNPEDYECDIPPNYLAKMIVNISILNLLYLIRKNECKFFTLHLEKQVEIMPELVYYLIKKGKKNNKTNNKQSNGGGEPPVAPLPVIPDSDSDDDEEKKEDTMTTDLKKCSIETCSIYRNV
eukprot:UN02037